MYNVLFLFFLKIGKKDLIHGISALFAFKFSARRHLDEPYYVIKIQNGGAQEI